MGRAVMMPTLQKTVSIATFGSLILEPSMIKAQSAKGASAFVSDLKQSNSVAYTFDQTESDYSPKKTWGKAFDELLSFRLLEDDWDGDGTLAPKHEVVDTALNIALQLRSLETTTPDFVIVGVNSTIFFEWHYDTFVYEIEVISPNDVEFRNIDRN
jgi:hypothetical protein